MMEEGSAGIADLQVDYALMKAAEVLNTAQPTDTAEVLEVSAAWRFLAHSWRDTRPPEVELVFEPDEEELV